MNINFNWKVKHIATDTRGYGSIGNFEMEGTDIYNNYETANVVVCFGGNELKPISHWSQDEIDNYAEKYREMLELQIKEQLEARIKALETSSNT